MKEIWNTNTCNINQVLYYILNQQHLSPGTLTVETFYK